MTETIYSFLKMESVQTLKITDRLVATLWWHHKNGSTPVSFSQIADENEEAGYAAINRVREREKLRKDSRTSSGDKGKSFKLQIRALKALDERFINLLDTPPIPTNSNRLFHERDFKNTRGYIERVIHQINISYDVALYDCCAVMIRRLLETLLIEVYEKLGRADELKAADGNFMMFSGLLAYVKSDQSLNLGRQTISGLEGFKRIADSSAHNRRFLASKAIIDDKIDGVKLAVVELRELAFR